MKKNRYGWDISSHETESDRVKRKQTQSTN